MADDFRGWNIPPHDAQDRIAKAIRKCVGRELRDTYGRVLKEPVPANIAILLRRLDNCEQ